MAFSNKYCTSHSRPLRTPFITNNKLVHEVLAFPSPPQFHNLRRSPTSHPPSFMPHSHQVWHGHLVSTQLTLADVELNSCLGTNLSLRNSCYPQLLRLYVFQDPDVGLRLHILWLQGQQSVPFIAPNEILKIADGMADPRSTFHITFTIGAGTTKTFAFLELTRISRHSISKLIFQYFVTQALNRISCAPPISVVSFDGKILTPTGLF